MTDTLTLDVDSIAAGGDGVARHDGLVVFVPRTAPGDRVVARVSQRGRMARGVLERVSRAASERIEPRCPHYEGDHCGGCQLQHLSLGAQREAKRRIIADAFRRIGKREVPAPEIIAGDLAWRYRSKLTLALRLEHGAWRGGLHAFDDPERVFALRDCLIADERLVAAWREIVAAGAHLPRTERLRGSARLLGDGTTIALVLEGAREWSAHEAFFAQVQSIGALWWIPEDGTRRLLHDRRGGAAGGEGGASFAQVNSEMAPRLAAFVTESAMAHAPATVIDAYAGTGDVAAALARRGVRVTAIEFDAQATAVSAARLPHGSRAVAARVEDVLHRALPADVVVLNPPRAGVQARVTSLLEGEARTRAILYVSCDPATLARDVARLPSWKVERLTAFDLFPQTAHVETVCELVPGEGA
ncbi:MAG: class I SAM-dependent RNA methyltransferase [Gemmatimonadales bacterium]